jgi:hypothetical protein
MTHPLDHFEHRMAAHCESGTVSALLRHAGLELSEPMVFGGAGALFFGYFNSAMLPFPTVVLRSLPGRIRANIEKRTGVHFRRHRFLSTANAMRQLDALLERGIPVAVQVDFFYMRYIPKYARAHFNAHYVVVVGRRDGRYLISDSYAPQVAELEAEVLATARFAKGPFAPRGNMFYIDGPVPATIDHRAMIRKGISQAAFYMLKVPFAFAGVRGIRTFAEQVTKWPALTRDEEHLSHEVMMVHVVLEERGTGGGGGRFLYASFLKEAADRLGHDGLREVSARMMLNGDRWRDISLFVARIGRNRDLGAERLRELSDLIRERATAEDTLFRELRTIAATL